MKNIAIIGAGHVGVSLFCDLLVRLPDGKARTKLFHVREGEHRWSHGVDLVFNDLFNGSSHGVNAPADSFDWFYSDSAANWMKSATYIVLTIPDIPYLRPKVIQYLLERVGLEGKVLVLCRGGQGGTPYFANLIRRDERLHDTHTILIEDSFYGTRFIDNRVDCKRKYKINVAVLSRDANLALKLLQDIFPPKAGSNLPSWPHFEAKPSAALLFDPLGYIIHVGVAFYEKNLERTGRGEVYTHYTDGIDMVIAEKLEKLDIERVAIARAFGIQVDTFPQTISRQYNKPILPNFYDMMQSCRDIYKSKSASSMDGLVSSRYVSEDIPPLFTMLRLADIAGYEAPATRSYLIEVRGKMKKLGIEESTLRTYIDGFPEVGDKAALLDLLNKPIPSAFDKNISIAA
ncbi:MAG: NAD/NADP octopine/nopaline dehydrogenase family protein [Gammaproteobacteria bacterium]|nr:NAD/NADP octopine/nopaline dehydrogenase family protein [Gammaproteobacteria bacterium]